MILSGCRTTKTREVFWTAPQPASTPQTQPEEGK